MAEVLEGSPELEAVAVKMAAAARLRAAETEARATLPAADTAMAGTVAAARVGLAAEAEETDRRAAAHSGAVEPDGVATAESCLHTRQRLRNTKLAPRRRPASLRCASLVSRCAAPHEPQSHRRRRVPASWRVAGAACWPSSPAVGHPRRRSDPCHRSAPWFRRTKGSRRSEEPSAYISSAASTLRDR